MPANNDSNLSAESDDGALESPQQAGTATDAIGESPAFLDFQESLRRVAPVERPVLLIGERGTGKEIAARRLHFLSRRWGQPFVALNCSALSPTLIESELFGHEEGAFTGARRRRLGRFEAANGGTLFLDEISLIPIEVQEKILRVVEYGAFERVGGSRGVSVDVRIVGATNADLAREAARGKFKQDLLDRLSFEVLFLPPLRARGEDILLLARHFANRMFHELGRDEIPEFSEAAAQALVNHPWPGNVREIKNVVERAAYRSETATIDTLEFAPFESPYAPGETVDRVDRVDEVDGKSEPDRSNGEEEVGLSALRGRSLQDALGEMEIRFLRQALEQARYNQREAADLLGLTYHQFRGLYRKHAEALKT
ncbi:phage shock protein operon transcriptional activator [Candidatus Sumerlaeota bacterium]|nr:phage shock protein operon transcriptional activator [Candidatus Sumerlaeota bacterium]